MVQRRTSHQLLIYHDDARVYHEILTERLPRLEIRSATRPEEAWDFIEEAEIILSWQIPDDLSGQREWIIG